MCRKNSEKKKFDSKIIAYIAGGAVLGGITGYVISKVGIKKVTAFLKEKEVIPKNISKLIDDFDFKTFTSKNIDEDLKDIMDE
ncbi:MAG TPA: hypothetical protein DCY00_01130 [Actinobacteria bacterium]|jgi:hypothetical protein|nr:hypothetical protein [Actinomycetota bacterium]